METSSRDGYGIGKMKRMRKLILIIVFAIFLSSCKPTGSQDTSSGYLTCRNAYTGIVTYEGNVEWTVLFRDGIWKAYDGEHSILTNDVCVFVGE